MAIGELLGGAVQLFGSWCMFGGGAVVTTTGIGAIIGAPALAASVGLAGAGILNITSGVQNLIGALNSLSSGGGVSQGPAPPSTKQVTPTRTAEAPKYKVPRAGLSGKEGAKDVPSWTRGQRPYVGESGKDFARRLLDEKYGAGNWKEGANTEFNKIRKWGDRAFENP